MDWVGASLPHLPELKLSGDLKLLEARVEVQLQALGQREVGAVALGAVLVEVRQMVAQDLAQARGTRSCACAAGRRHEAPGAPSSAAGHSTRVHTIQSRAVSTAQCQ